MSEEIQAQLAQLNGMIAKGIRKGKLGDEEVEFRDLTEMYRIRTDLERQLAPTPVSRQHYPTFSRGT